MRGSRVKRLRRILQESSGRVDINFKPGRIGKGTIGFEVHSPNERARQQQVLLPLHAENNSGESGSENKTSEEFQDEGNMELNESNRTPNSSTDSNVG